MHMASALSLLLCLYSLFPSLPPLPPRLSLSPFLPRRGFYGHFALLVVSKHGFSTERARLARGYFVSYYLGAHGFSIERARLAGGTSLRSWFQKKCLLPVGIRFFFSKKSPIFKIGDFLEKKKSKSHQVAGVFF